MKEELAHSQWNEKSIQDVIFTIHSCCPYNYRASKRYEIAN